MSRLCANLTLDSTAELAINNNSNNSVQFNSILVY